MAMSVKPGLKRGAAPTVAAFGHRPNRLPRSKMLSIAPHVANALEAVRGVLAEAAPNSAGRARPRVLTNLAEGADRLVTIAALDADLAIGAILPFPRDIFENDFASAASREEFRGLLGRCTDLRELDGQREDAPRAYEAAAHALLDEADLAIAVWDGAPGAGQGGTAESVAEALRRGLAVVHIPVDGKAPRLLEAPAEHVLNRAIQDGLRAALSGAFR